MVLGPRCNGSKDKENSGNGDSKYQDTEKSPEHCVGGQYRGLHNRVSVSTSRERAILTYSGAGRFNHSHGSSCVGAAETFNLFLVGS